MSVENRIKLAEWMGWRNCEPEGYVNVDGVPTCCPAGEPPPFDEPPYIAACPDPFTDANDDYAVLEWMRDPIKDGKFHPDWRYFGEILEEDMTYNYQIGDYARAALKVLPDTDEEGAGT